MTTAMQPAIYAKLVLGEADVQGIALGEDQLEHGNEDQPDAYRGLPVDEKDLSCNIVMIKDPDMTIVFQIVYALSFVLSLVSRSICVGLCFNRH